MMNEQFEELLDGGEAVRYLAQRWNIESYSIDAFRMLRYRYNIKPILASSNSTFWRKADLDKIPQPSRHNPRPKRAKKNAGNGKVDGRDPSVMHTRCRVNVA